MVAEIDVWNECIDRVDLGCVQPWQNVYLNGDDAALNTLLCYAITAEKYLRSFRGTFWAWLKTSCFFLATFYSYFAFVKDCSWIHCAHCLFNTAGSKPVAHRLTSFRGNMSFNPETMAKECTLFSDWTCPRSALQVTYMCWVFSERLYNQPTL